MQQLRLLRPINLVLIAIIQAIVQYSVIVRYAIEPESLFTHFQFGLIVLITMLAGAAGYVVNDIYDVAIDALNKPGKNVVGFGVKRPIAWLIYSALVISGGGLTLLLGQPYAVPGIAMYVVTTALLWAYSWKFKKTPLAGNIIVSIFAALVIYVLWLGQGLKMTSASTMTFAHYVVIMYSAFAFLSTLLRELVKDIEDVSGDAMMGAYTLPAVAGVHLTSRLCLAIDVALIAVICYWLSRMFQELNLLALGFMMVVVIMPLVVVAWVLNKAQTPKHWHRISQLIKGIILAGTLFLLLI